LTSNEQYITHVLVITTRTYAHWRLAFHFNAPERGYCIEPQHDMASDSSCWNPLLQCRYEVYDTVWFSS